MKELKLPVWSAKSAAVCVPCVLFEYSAVHALALSQFGVAHGSAGTSAPETFMFKLLEKRL